MSFFKVGRTGYPLGPSARDPLIALFAKSPLPGLGAITGLAVLVHGYHLGVDDAAIYVPAIKRVADPKLYPFGAEFFMSHAHLSLFPELIGGSARLSHLPIDTVIFAWHVVSIFLLLLAAWQLLGCCFVNSYARWSGVALLAATLSVPVAGTGLVIMDPYLTARSLSTPATLFAIACYLSKRPRWAVAWLVLTAALHPQMAVYGLLFLGVMEVGRRLRLPEAARPVCLAMIGLPLFDFSPVTGPARECLLSRTFFFVSAWAWYEWIGVFAPLALLWWLSKASLRHTLPAFRKLAGSLVPFGLVFTAAFVILAIPALEGYTRLQPMRSFHLLYVIFFVLLGGLMIWGLQPGPLLFVEQKDFVWGLIASMYLSNVAGLIIVLTTVPLFAAILRIPFSIIAPVIIVLCAIGAYSVHSAMLDIWFMVLFGVIGYVLKKLDYPLAPLVLSLVLGDRAENAFRQTMLGSKGSMAVFWSNTLVGTITTLALIMLFWPMISLAWRKLRQLLAGGRGGEA